MARATVKPSNNVCNADVMIPGMSINKSCLLTVNESPRLLFPGVYATRNRKIIRTSNSPYRSPIVLVRKKCGNRRLAIDFRFLNEMTIRDNFPIPRTEDLIDSLRGKTYFAQLDLKEAFHHVELEAKCIPYIVCPRIPCSA